MYCARTDGKGGNFASSFVLAGTDGKTHSIRSENPLLGVDLKNSASLV